MTEPKVLDRTEDFYSKLHIGVKFPKIKERTAGNSGLDSGLTWRSDACLFSCEDRWGGARETPSPWGTG
jgi:hypothetical protein